MKSVRFAKRMGFEKGIEEVIENAIKQGFEMGVLIGQVRLCQELLKQPQTPRADLAGMPQEQLMALLLQLRKQLSPNGS